MSTDVSPLPSADAFEGAPTDLIGGDLGEQLGQLPDEDRQAITSAVTEAVGIAFESRDGTKLDELAEYVGDPGAIAELPIRRGTRALQQTIDRAELERMDIESLARSQGVVPAELERRLAEHDEKTRSIVYEIRQRERDESAWLAQEAHRVDAEWRGSAIDLPAVTVQASRDRWAARADDASRACELLDAAMHAQDRQAARAIAVVARDDFDRRSDAGEGKWCAAVESALHALEDALLPDRVRRARAVTQALRRAELSRRQRDALLFRER